MLLGCPSCHATFRVPAGAVKDKGRNVRCAKCRHEWHAYPKDLIPELSAEAALETASAIEKKMRQEELEKQRHEVESMLAGMGMAIQDPTPSSATTAREHEKPYATSTPPVLDELNHINAFDFDAIPVQDPEDEKAVAYASATPASAQMDTPAQLSATHQETQELDEEDFSTTALDEHASEEHVEEEHEEPEQAYKVTEEEMSAFSSLVSQEELDAINTSTSAISEADDAQNDFDVIEERLAAMEAARPATSVQNQTSSTKAKPSSDSTLWLSLTLAACILLCISTAFVTQQDYLRSQFPFIDKLYNQIGFPSSKGLEIVDLKLTKNQLADKTSYDIEGAIQNNRTSYAGVPAVRIRLVDSEQKTMRSWDFSQERKMEPNEKISFAAPKLKALTGTEGTPAAFYVDIGNSIEMMQRK
jgi:predicted Zn finger-like uncharacterized protein